MSRKICYVIGAGLTKALEMTPAHRVPLMVDFVSVLADYIGNDVVLTALTNFEKGSVFDWSRSEWVKLAEALDSHAAPDLRQRYAEVLRRRPAENIEQLLRNAVKRKAGNLYAALVELRFGFAINAVFARIGWNLRHEILTTYLARQFALPETTHTFVSYNYDLALDRCVQETANGRWSPATGYGMSFDEVIVAEEAIEHMTQFVGSGGAFSLLDPHAASKKPSEIHVLKPHGSLNWFVPFEENYKFLDDDPLLLLDQERRIAYTPEFSVLHISNTRQPAQIAFDAALLITPPLDEDSAPAFVPAFLSAIEDQSIAAVRDADEILVIGWSMPSTDKAEVSKLRAAMRAAKPDRRLTAVNFHADVTYFKALADVLNVPESNTTVFNAGFGDFAVNS